MTNVYIYYQSAQYHEVLTLKVYTKTPKIISIPVTLLTKITKYFAFIKPLKFKLTDFALHVLGNVSHVIYDIRFYTNKQKIGSRKCKCFLKRHPCYGNASQVRLARRLGYENETKRCKTRLGSGQVEWD